MTFDLDVAADPRTTALLAMELQRGVVGDLSRFPELVQVASERGVIPNAARLATAARPAGVPVVHCTAAFRADRVGSHTDNCPFIRALLRDPDHMREGTAAIDVLPELGPHEEDVESRRYHGFSPFTGTALDQTLRSLGITTVVAIGVSLNLGIPGMCLEAVNLGYRAIVPTDAVAGVPADYSEAVLTHTIGLLAAKVTTGELATTWETAAHPARPRP